MAKSDLIAYLKSLPFLYPPTEGVNAVDTSGDNKKSLSGESEDTMFVDLAAIGGTSDFESLAGSPTLATVQKWLSKHSPPLTMKQVTRAVCCFTGVAILAISAGAHGSTDPAAGLHDETTDTEIEVTPTAGEGYTFDYWLLDEQGFGPGDPSDHHITVLMDGPHTLQPIFKAAQ